MPHQFDTPVLAVDRELLHKVDAANPHNLFSMWAVFSKCADSVQQGRRLEYICWRYWNKQALTSSSDITPLFSSPTLARPIASTVASEDAEVPELSRSVGSEQDEEAIEFTTDAEPVPINQPQIRRQDSTVRSESFEKLFVSILNQKGGLNKSPISLPTRKPTTPKQEARPSGMTRSGSTTTESSAHSSEDGSMMSSQASPSRLPTHSIVKGFDKNSPSVASIPKQPIVKISPDSIDVQAMALSKLVKKNATFQLGGASPSSSEAGQSSLKLRKPIAKRMFQLGTPNSSEERQSPRPNSLRVPQIKAQSAVDSEDDYDESAIDDDDDDESDWEDSEEPSHTPSIDDKTMFQRVDSQPVLTSRRSLLTVGLANAERARKLGNAASQSTSALHRSRQVPAGHRMAGSPNDSDETPLMMKGPKNPGLQRISEVPRAQAQPINAVAIPPRPQAALSPRATRRHMLATELTDSLRRHIVWERQYKNSTANAVLKRRHTSNDLANLKQHPEPVFMKKSEDQNASSFNQYFSKDVDGGYHAKGW